MLPGSAFVRVHRSFLVAADKINSFTPEEIEIDKHVIPIGKYYRLQVLKHLNDGKSW